MRIGVENILAVTARAELGGAPFADDVRLAARCQKGDSVAQKQLVDKYKGQIYRIGFMLSRNKEDANDFSQEVFLRIFHNIGKYRGDCPISAWISVIAINARSSGAKRFARIRRFISRLTSSNSDDDFNPERNIKDPLCINPEEHFLFNERILAIKKAISSMPQEWREVILMRYSDHSYEQISAALNIALGTVASRMNRARKYLDEYMINHADKGSTP